MPDISFNDLNNAQDLDLYLCIITENDLICRDCQNSTGCILTCKNFKRRKPSSIFIYNYCIEYIPKDK